MRHIAARLGLALLAALAFGGANGQQLTTNFDNIATLPAAGWVFTNNSVGLGSANWFQGNSAVFGSQAGVATSYLGGNFNAAAFGGNISLWALTPTLTNLQNGQTLTFYTRTEPGAPAADRLEVRLSTNGGSSNVGANDTTVGDFTTVLTTINPALTLAGYPQAWTLQTVTLSGLPVGANTGRIGFRYFVTNTSANADYIGIDTVNVTGSAIASDLSVTKTHVGNFSQGQTGATYTITVSNAAAAGATDGSTVTVTDTLPAGLTATAISGTGWTCPQPAGPCTRSDALAAGSAYPPLTLTVNVGAAAASPQVNNVTVSGGGDVTPGNNTASDSTVITAAAPDLTITSTHTGSFAPGSSGGAFLLTVTNIGNAPTFGTVTVVDTLGPGMSATAISGAGWTCTLATRTCTRSDALAPSASYPVITVTVSVASNAPSTLTNSATVSGGGETNVSNDTGNDIVAAAALIVPTLSETMLVVMSMLLGLMALVGVRRRRN